MGWEGSGSGWVWGGGGGLKLLQWPASLLSCRNLQFIHYHSLILMAQLTLNYQHLFLANTSILASLQKFTIYPLPWSHSNGSADNYQHLFLANSSDLYQSKLVARKIRQSYLKWLPLNELKLMEKVYSCIYCSLRGQFSFPGVPLYMGNNRKSTSKSYLKQFSSYTERQIRWGDAPL